MNSRDLRSALHKLTYAGIVLIATLVIRSFVLILVLAVSTFAGFQAERLFREFSSDENMLVFVAVTLTCYMTAMWKERHYTVANQLLSMLGIRTRQPHLTPRTK